MACLAYPSGVERHRPQPGVSLRHQHRVLRRAALRQLPDAAAGNLVTTTHPLRERLISGRGRLAAVVPPGCCVGPKVELRPLDFSRFYCIYFFIYCAMPQ